MPAQLPATRRQAEHAATQGENRHVPLPAASRVPRKVVIEQRHDPHGCGELLVALRQQPRPAVPGRGSGVHPAGLIDKGQRGP
jgi:hypothetical protein